MPSAIERERTRLLDGHRDRPKEAMSFRAKERQVTVQTKQAKLEQDIIT